MPYTSLNDRLEDAKHTLKHPLTRNKCCSEATPTERSRTARKSRQSTFEASLPVWAGAWAACRHVCVCVHACVPFLAPDTIPAASLGDERYTHTQAVPTPCSLFVSGTS